MQNSLFSNQVKSPLADRLRPEKIEDIIGQDHIIGSEGPLSQMLKSGAISSFILWGPPGCGKTTMARILAETSECRFTSISAIFSGVADLKKLFEEARERKAMGETTLLFVDEIHRFNKAQQDSFLPVVEDGTIILVGATTENPSFEINSALLSRCQVYILERLDNQSLDELLTRAENLEDKKLPLNSKTRNALISMADGDGRFLLNMAEQLFRIEGKKKLDEKELIKIVQKRLPIYDKKQDSHYNLISALHKSLRGSDVNAALYWFARMLDGGEDPLYIARRLIRFASEDVGMADPQALVQCNLAWEVYHKLGSPEGELAITQAVVYLATAPKSNALYSAYNSVRQFAKKTGSYMPPKHILNAPTSLMKDIGYGDGYLYDHGQEDGFSGQNYFPDDMERQAFYQPVERGFERDIQKRLEYWQKLRDKKSQD